MVGIGVDAIEDNAQMGQEFGDDIKGTFEMIY